MLRFLTAGESHGQALVVIVEGLPAGLAVTVEDVQRVGQDVIRENRLNLAVIGPFDDAERFEKLLAFS